MEEALDEQGCICYINITTGILLEQAITFIYQLLLHIFIKEPVEYVRQHTQIGVRLKNQISVFQLRILEYQIKDLIFTKGVRMIENNKLKGCHARILTPYYLWQYRRPAYNMQWV